MIPASGNAAAEPGELAGKKALVTGGAAGLGKATAAELARLGAAVTVADLNAEAAGEVAERIGGQAWVVDLSDTAALEDLKLDYDILVNNAGIQRIHPIHEFPPAEWRLIQTLMLEAPFLLIRATLEHMYRAKWGRIINISSAHGLRASPFKGAYVTAKHGLEGLTKTCALEGGPHGVTANTVNPGYVRTKLVDDQIADQAASRGISKEEVTEQVFLAHSAIPRLAEADEVAALVGFLASPRAAMITGTHHSIDGGWTAG